MAVNPLLADPPAAQSSEQPPTPATSSNGAAASNGASAEPPKLLPAERRACRNCGAALTDEQEWCLQCGAGAPGTLASERDWRPLAVIAGAAAILLAGAATAAYAALNQTPTKPPPHVLIAQVPPPTTTPPSTLSTPTNTLPPTTTPPTTTGKNGSSTLGLPSGTIRPPRLPAVVPTPSGTALNPNRATTPLPLPNPTRTTTPTNTTSTPTNTTPEGTTTPAAQTPNPILLDTNAASTYNPSGYPSSYFGDPSLAIDGDTTTSWTAQVEPKVAPLMAAGLALDFKKATKLGSLEVITTTPGMTVEVFGANGHTLPAAITDPGWTKLTPNHLIKKKTATIRLATGGKGFRFLVLWLTKAPTAAIGTPEAPGHVSIGEVVPYPPSK
jgi:hypothetical protein